jgi:hypothetical protein
MEIRKIVTVVEDIFMDGERKVVRPVRKVAAIAVIRNPYAGTYQEDLSPLVYYSEEIGRMGDSIDIPLHFKDAAFVRSHFDAMTVSIGDAPKADEILLAVAVTDGGRPNPRVGGLKKEEAKGEDGLR